MNPQLGEHPLPQGCYCLVNTTFTATDGEPMAVVNVLCRRSRRIVALVWRKWTRDNQSLFSLGSSFFVFFAKRLSLASSVREFFHLPGAKRTCIKKRRVSKKHMQTLLVFSMLSHFLLWPA